MSNVNLVTAVVGAAAVVVAALAGAWINSYLSTRRERWNLRRDLYTRLLENLGEANEAIYGLMHTTQSTLPEEELIPRITHLNEQALEAYKQIQRAASVAAILLGDEALQALHELRHEVVKARQTTDQLKYLDEERAAVIKAQRLVVSAARRELGTSRRLRSWFWSKWKRLGSKENSEQQRSRERRHP